MKTYKVTINDNGTIRWFKEGAKEYHREDGPAIEYSNVILNPKIKETYYVS
jgi:hypothetical protein